jgi:putative DNA primase/helicase
MDVHDQLARAGLEIDGTLEYGRLVRCRADGDKGRKTSGWYVLHELRLDSGQVVTVGRYGNWKRYGPESIAVEFAAAGLSDDERARLAAEQARLRAEAEAERQARAADAARRAGAMWPKLPDSGASPYLDRKKVRAYGVRFSRGSIVVPVRRGDGALVGLQFIGPDGGKKFLTGTPKRGCWHWIGEPPAPTDGALVWIAEGYATAATVHEATGCSVACAFDSGNLMPVAQALRGLYPAARIAIAADNDAATEGNPGVTKAREAALAVGGVVVVPDFSAVAA